MQRTLLYLVCYHNPHKGLQKFQTNVNYLSAKRNENTGIHELSNDIFYLDVKYNILQRFSIPQSINAKQSRL
jgi:hypothetical protein